MESSIARKRSKHPDPPNPRIRRAIACAGLLVALAAGAGCASSFVDARPTGPRFAAYWSAGPGAPGCPAGEECVAFRSGLPAFEALIDDWRRRRGLELVRFDARVSPAGSTYAGAWERSYRPHRLEADLDWEGFLRLHRRYAREGLRLAHLKVYDRNRRQRVAAIWRPDDEGGPEPARVVRDQDWKWFRETQESLDAEGYHLEEFEIYRRPDGPDDVWLAGVFRPGRAETRLLDGLTCERPFDDQVGVPIPDASGRTVDLHLYSRCELLLELERQNGEGFQAVDLEQYREAGQEKWAVLLHRRSGVDWLRFPASRSQIGYRETRLNPSSTPDPPVLGAAAFRLLDLDLYRVGDRIQEELRGQPDDRLRVLLDDFPTHNGVVHDGGSSGPP